MISRKERLRDFKLYAVTDLRSADAGYVKKIEGALNGGADIVQLRSKALMDGDLVRIGAKIRAVVVKYGKLFFVNDRPDLCLALDADGVHIGQDDLPVAMVRKLVGKDRLIGKSTHSVAQARATLTEDVDYIGFGPVYATPTKPAYEPVGLPYIKQVMKLAARAKKPVVCIGGISIDTIEDVIEAGAERVAVVRALFDAANVEHRARELRWFLENAGK